MFVFRVYERVSYALVMGSRNQIEAVTSQMEKRPGQFIDPQS